MKLQFNAQGYLHGAYTINYLLERSRVVGVAVISLFFSLNYFFYNSFGPHDDVSYEDSNRLQPFYY